LIRPFLPSAPSIKIRETIREISLYRRGEKRAILSVHLCICVCVCFCVCIHVCIRAMQNMHGHISASLRPSRMENETRWRERATKKKLRSAAACRQSSPGESRLRRERRKKKESPAPRDPPQKSQRRRHPLRPASLRARARAFFKITSFFYSLLLSFTRFV
jgi:hypothetical protein